MSDFAIAALAHEHIRELQHEAADARLAREATARRRAVVAARRPLPADMGVRLKHLWAGLPVHRPSAQPCGC